MKEECVTRSGDGPSSPRRDSAVRARGHEKRAPEELRRSSFSRGIVLRFRVLPIGSRIPIVVVFRLFAVCRPVGVTRSLRERTCRTSAFARSLAELAHSPQTSGESGVVDRDRYDIGPRRGARGRDEREQEGERRAQDSEVLRRVQ